jgi:DNA processing protein
VANAVDVVDEAGPIGLRAGVDGDVERDLDAVRALDGLSGDALVVYEALPALGASGVRELSEASGIAVEKVRAVLPMLEMEGFVDSGDTGWSRQR